MMQMLRSQGKWMKRRILVGASWKLGNKSSPESPDCF
jgi:hypothetical protein